MQSFACCSIIEKKSKPSQQMDIAYIEGRVRLTTSAANKNIPHSLNLFFISTSLLEFVFERGHVHNATLLRQLTFPITLLHPRHAQVQKFFGFWSIGI